MSRLLNVHPKDPIVLSTYAPLFRVPGAKRFITGGMIARSAGAMFGVAVVAMIAGRRGSYELAGAVMAVGMLALALFAPFLGRLVDRHGQRRVAIPFFLWSGSWAVLTIVASLRDWPAWVLFITFPLCGAIPNLGTMARARWSHIFRDDPRSLHTALSFEQVMEEVTFVVGPVLAIWLSVALFPEAGFVFATVCYGVGVLIFISARSTEPPVVPHHERPAGGAHRNPGLIPLAFIMTMTGVIFGVNEVVTLAVAEHAGHKAAAGPILGLYAVGSALSGLVFGSISHGRSLIKLLLAGTLGMVILEAPLLFAPNLPVLAIVMLFAGIATVRRRGRPDRRSPGLPRRRGCRRTGRRHGARDPGLPHQAGPAPAALTRPRTTITPLADPAQRHTNAVVCR